MSRKVFLTTAVSIEPLLGVVAATSGVSGTDGPRQLPLDMMPGVDGMDSVGATVDSQ